MTRYLLLLSCAFALALSAVAQTKITGSLDCNKADPRYVIQIPDQEGSAYSIAQFKCAWTKGFALEGLQPKDYVNTVFVEAMGSSAEIIAAGVSHYANGDAAYSRSTGTRDTKALTSSGKWTFTLGTGKLRGIKGSGTYTCKMKSAEPDAGYTCESEGQYALPVAKK
jgi:hypothetical protein